MNLDREMVPSRKASERVMAGSSPIPSLRETAWMMYLVYPISVMQVSVWPLAATSLSNTSR